MSGVTLTYIDYLNKDGEVIDSTLRDEDGNDLSADSSLFDDYGPSELMEYIQENLA